MKKAAAEYDGVCKYVCWLPKLNVLLLKAFFDKLILEENELSLSFKM